MPLVLGIVPPPEPERLDRAIERACRELLSLGVVAAHDPSEVNADVALAGGFAAYERLGAAGRLPVRIHASVRPESLERAIGRGLRSGAPLGGEGSAATVGWVKIFADGTLGARTARMLAPYEPDPVRGPAANDGLGVHVTAPEAIERIVVRAAAAGIVAQVHAIGDGANREVLRILAATPRGRLRARVEHAQIVAPEDQGRFGRDGIAACVMPRDVRADAANAFAFWGRARTEAGAYAYRSLAAGGALIPFGTDAPVEPPDPWPQIASAVTRRDPAWGAEREAFVASQALPLDRALRAACLDAALTAGESDRGRLIPGYRADLIAIPAAALAQPVEPHGPLETCRPSLVLVGGVPVVG